MRFSLSTKEVSRDGKVIDGLINQLMRLMRDDDVRAYWMAKSTSGVLALTFLMAASILRRPLVGVRCDVREGGGGEREGQNDMKGVR